VNKTTAALKLAEIEDLQDSVTKALKKAFQLGQTYWQQADSESFSQNKKADETQAKFYELEDEAIVAIREALANHSGGANEMVAEPVQILPGGGLVGKAEPVKQHTEQYWLHEINNARADGYERGYMAAKKLYAEPVKQEPVATVNANDEGYWADILPDRDVKVGQLLYVAPVSVEAAVLAERKRCAEACYLRAQSWKDNAARAAKLCGDAITSMGDTT